MLSLGLGHIILNTPLKNPWKNLETTVYNLETPMKHTWNVTLPLTPSLGHPWDIREIPYEYNFYKTSQQGCIGWAVTILKIMHLSPEAVVTWAFVPPITASFIASWVVFTEWTNCIFIPFECNLKMLSYVQLSLRQLSPGQVSPQSGLALWLVELTNILEELSFVFTIWIQLKMELCAIVWLGDDPRQLSPILR